MREETHAMGSRYRGRGVEIAPAVAFLVLLVSVASAALTEVSLRVDGMT